MFNQGRTFVPRSDRGPLRAMFVTTSMPVGGAETLLVNLVRKFDRARVVPEICCLKEPGVLGTILAKEVPVHSGLLKHKYDWRVYGRLRRLFQERRIDAVVTVGAGDKMFWGRLVAWRGGVPVIASALHSTGWPDVVTRLNRYLTPITDAFIAVAHSHGRFLIDRERFPASKVAVIPNGVDTEKFQPSSDRRIEVRRELGIPFDAPTFGVVAALRPEKNLSVFVEAARQLSRSRPDSHFVVIGEGPERPELERAAAGLGARFRFLGTRQDVHRLLPALDVFTLTSRMEASPVSILEAMACGLPIVATNVGSVSENVLEGITGFLVPVDDTNAVVAAWQRIVGDRQVPLSSTAPFQIATRQRVLEHGSLTRMVAGYEQLLAGIYERKCRTNSPIRAGGVSWDRPGGQRGQVSVGESAFPASIQESPW